jgi:hypothetical protein
MSASLLGSRGCFLFVTRLIKIVSDENSKAILSTNTLSRIGVTFRVIAQYSWGKPALLGVPVSRLDRLSCRVSMSVTHRPVAQSDRGFERSMLAAHPNAVQLLQLRLLLKKSDGTNLPLRTDRVISPTGIGVKG